MRGDFVLFYQMRGSWQEWLIAKFTNGQFIHAEVDLGDAWIGMTSSGMRRHAPSGLPFKTRTVHVESEVGQPGIEAGLRWVERAWADAQRSREVHEYGWADIVSDALKALGLGILSFGRKGEWDCSDFVVRYLIEALAAGPLGTQADDPGTVSPNDLARSYKVPMTQ